MTDVTYQDVLRVRTSKAEQLQYGEFAPFARLAGDMAVAASSLVGLLNEMLSASYEADQLTAGTSAVAEERKALAAGRHVEHPRLDDMGRSEHTRWLTDLYEDARPIIDDVARFHRRFALEVATRHDRLREPLREATDITP